MVKSVDISISGKMIHNYYVSMQNQKSTNYIYAHFTEFSSRENGSLYNIARFSFKIDICAIHNIGSAKANQVSLIDMVGNTVRKKSYILTHSNI